jgi:hypothetical protein
LEAIAAARLKPSVETLPQPRKPRGNKRIEDSAELIARIAGLVRHERAHRVENRHEIAVDAIGVDRRLVGDHHLTVSGKSLVACRLNLRRHVAWRPSSARRALGNLQAQRLQGEACVTDHGLRCRVHLVDVQLIDVAVDDRLFRCVGNRVTETAR